MSDSDTGGTMSFDFTTLITDRSKADVDTLSALLSKPLGQWTEEELAAYNGGAMKGGYWWTDLNRVSACMEYLDEQLRSMGYETGYIPIRLDRPEIVLPGRLPEGYTELEYIESNGNQYIDSLIKPTGNTRVLCKVRFPTTNEGTWIFGARDGSGSKAYGFLSYQNQYRSDYDIARPLISASYGPDLLIDKDGGKTSVNGTLVDDAETFNFACQYNLLIGANSNTGSPMGYAKALHEWYKVYSGDTLLLDLVPCRSPDQEIGMFDLVDSILYTSSGSSFLAGPEVEPKIQPNPLDPYTWYPSDSPTDGQITQYLANVDRLRSVLSLAATTPDTPAPGGKTDPAWANNIERILISVETMIKNIQKTVDLGWAMGIAHIGLYGGA